MWAMWADQEVLLTINQSEEQMDDDVTNENNQNLSNERHKCLNASDKQTLEELFNIQNRKQA